MITLRSYINLGLWGLLYDEIISELDYFYEEKITKMDQVFK